MGKRAIIQLVGAILSGVNVAGPLILDAQNVWPEWAWQYHALIGFVIFAGWMLWIAFDKQGDINKLKHGRPLFTLGDQTGATAQEEKQQTEVHSRLRLFYKNIGLRPAYQLRLRVGFSPEDVPSQFTLFPTDVTSANRIDPGCIFEPGRTYNLVLFYHQKDSKKVLEPMGWLIYCVLSYSDAPSNGTSYNDEFWYSYRLDRAELEHMSIPKREELEPYVKLVCSRIKETN